MGTSLYDQFQKEQAGASTNTGSLYDQYIREQAAGSAPPKKSGFSYNAGVKSLRDSIRPAAESSGARLGSRPTPGEAGDFVSGLARSAEQGATFGFGDELNAAARSLFSSDTYDQALTDERAKLSKFRSDNPLLSFGTEIAGGLGAGGAIGAGAKLLGLGADAATAAAAAKPATLATKVVAGAKSLAPAAAAGGLAAAGSADGSIEDRLEAVPAGAAFGVGTVLGGKAVGGIARGVRGKLPTSLATRLGEATPEAAARADVLTQLDRGGLSVDDVRAAAANAPDDAMMLDVGGKPLLRRARGAQSIPSQGSADIESALQARVAGQPGRVQATVAEALTPGSTGPGAARQNAVLSARGLIDARRTAAAPLYDAAYKSPDIDDPDIHGLFKHPQFLDAYAQGQRLATLEGTPLPPLFKTSDVGGEQVREQIPIPIRSLDYTKKGLDAMIDARAGTSNALSRYEAKLLRDKLNEALNIADTHSPDYAAARGQFAGDSRLIDAHERGQGFLQESGDELAADWPGMSDGEKALYRRGALSSLSEQLSKVTDGRDVTRVFQNPLMRDKLRTILPDQQTANDFMGQLAHETSMHKNAQFVLSGSPTARIAAEQSDEGVNPLNSVQALGHGWRGAMLKVASKALEKEPGLTAAKVDALAPYLTARGPALSQALNDLSSADAARRAAAARKFGPLLSRAFAETSGLRLQSPDQ